MSEFVVVEAADSYTYIAVRGPLDAAGVGSVDLRLTSQTVARRKPAIIDLSEVAFIASLGIGMLVMIAKAMKRQGAGIAIVAVTPQVLGVLEMTRVEPLIHVATSRDGALRALGVA